MTNNGNHQLEPESPEEVVICECGPDLNPGCRLGDHAEGHQVPAEWRVSYEDEPEMFMYLCSACLESVLALQKAGLVLNNFEPAPLAGGIGIEVDPEVWSLLAQRRLRLTRERGALVSLNDTIRDLLGEARS